MSVEATFDKGLAPDGDQFQAIRDVLATLQLGKVKVEATEVEESA